MRTCFCFTVTYGVLSFCLAIVLGWLRSVYIGDHDRMIPEVRRLDDQSLRRPKALGTDVLLTEHAMSVMIASVMSKIKGIDGDQNGPNS